MCVICSPFPPTLHTDPHKLFEAVWSCVIERHKPFPLHSQRLCGSYFRSPQRQLLESRLVGLPWPSLPDCMCAWRSSSPYVVCVCVLITVFVCLPSASLVCCVLIFTRWLWWFIHFPVFALFPSSRKHRYIFPISQSAFIDLWDATCVPGLCY